MAIYIYFKYNIDISLRDMCREIKYKIMDVNQMKGINYDERKENLFAIVLLVLLIAIILSILSYWQLRLVRWKN